MEAGAEEMDCDCSYVLFHTRVCGMLGEYTVQSLLPVNHHLGHISLTLRIWCLRGLPH